MLGFQWAQCRRVRPVLWDYASERLSEGPMELVEEHLQTCGACRAEVVTLQRAHRFLSACRAEEEPAPRSDWNALRQRMIEENVMPQTQTAFAPALVASGQDSARRGLRASWQMQLVTSTAGGFAAVLVIGAFYTLRPASPNTGAQIALSPVTISSSQEAGNRQVAANTNNGSVKNGDVNSSIKSSLVSASQEGVDRAGIIASMVRVLDKTRAVPDAVPAPDAAVSPYPAAVPANIVPDAASRITALTARPRSFSGKINSKERDTRIVGNIPNTASHTVGKLRFQPYTPKPQERLTTVARVTEGASHYALERVRPVSNDSDEAGAYVVGSVRPVSYDESGDY